MLVASLGVLFLVLSHILYLFYLSSAPDYPDDPFLSTGSNRRALIIVAHDDDAISMSGTLSMLTKQGWDVQELCFYQGYMGKDAIRKRDLDRATRILGMASPRTIDLELRKNREQVEKPWMPIPYAQFDSLYNQESARDAITGMIEEVQPVVIFTLDHIMGGYGHPDHVLISRMVLDYCTSRSRDSSFSVQRIYQAVFDPGMNERILKDMDAYLAAKSVYGVSASPAPHVSVCIRGHEEAKKQALMAFTTEQHALTRIWPWHRNYPACVYFGIFDREFYRVLDRNDHFQG